VKEGSDRVEVSVDHEEIVAGALRQPIDELELEMKGRDADGLFAVARRFAVDAVLRLSFESKAERGYGCMLEGLKGRAAKLASVIGRNARLISPNYVKPNLEGRKTGPHDARAALPERRRGG
jgi:inorganic triphosphatase YgiF